MVLRPGLSPQTRLRHLLGRCMLHFGLKMGIQINGARPGVSTSTFRCYGLDRKSSRRLLRTGPGIQNVFETTRCQAHGCGIRVHEKRKRGDLEPLLCCGLEGRGRTGVRTHGEASRKSGEDEVCKAVVGRFLVVAF